ncbi:MAG: hypothetical protein HFJ41_03815 [Clostridia bacterium]|nr:hypothetical protein [Clostridia bacterium]
MKEFDKIYIAKYKDILTIGQIAEDMRTTQKNINKILEELKETGLDTIYKNISDEEWEKLENKTDMYILKKYMNLSRKNNDKAFKELINEFNKIDLIESIRKFPVYELKKDNFNFNYFYEKDFKNEEWKKVGNLNYKVSNYGRIKNTNTKKLKQLKFNKYGMQVILWNNSKSWTITISRLVAEMFIRKVNKNERVIHKNGNTRDNYYKNLEIVNK